MQRNIQLTFIEKEFWEYARDLIVGLEKQVWINGYRVDFLVTDYRVVIELDGHDYHKTKEQRTHDAKRERSLKRLGYRVLRFTGTEIYLDIRGCVGEVLDFLDVLSKEKEALSQHIPDKYFCTRMQEVITYLANKHRFDLKSSDDYLKLEQKPFDPLTIQKLGYDVISVSHFFIQNGDICYDPRIEFFIDREFNEVYDEWTPIGIDQLLLGYRRCAKLQQDDDILITDRELNKDIAQYAEQWARHIWQNGWIENGEKINE